MQERGERIQIDIELGTPLYLAEQLAARTALELRSDVEFNLNKAPHVVTFEKALELYSQDVVLERVDRIKAYISRLERHIEEEGEDAKTELEYLALAEELRAAANP